MGDHLAVHPASHAMATLLEPAAKFSLVVDLPVEDGVDGPCLVHDGLLAVLHVDDREAPHPEPDVVLRPPMLAVRAPVRHRLDHLGQQLGIDAATGRVDAGYPAHDPPTAEAGPPRFWATTKIPAV